MPDELHATVVRRTTLDALYQRSAAHQSMTHYLRDWEKAHSELGKRIEKLRAMRDEREQEAALGLWPTPQDQPQVPIASAHEKVTDLLAALEESVTAAKAAKREHSGDQTGASNG